LTIVAVGTCAPEVAAPVVAAMRGHSALGVGNVIGSNIFNVVFVLAGAALVSPITASLTVFAIDVAVLSVFSIAAAVMIRRKRVIGRLEGFALSAAYAGYLLSLTLAAREPSASFRGRPRSSSAEPAMPASIEPARMPNLLIVSSRSS